MFLDISIDTRTRQKINELRDKAKHTVDVYRQIEKRLPPEEVGLWESIGWLQTAIAELENETDFFKESNSVESSELRI